MRLYYYYFWSLDIVFILCLFLLYKSVHKRKSMLDSLRVFFSVVVVAVLHWFTAFLFFHFWNQGLFFFSQIKKYIQKDVWSLDCSRWKGHWNEHGLFWYFHSIGESNRHVCEFHKNLIEAKSWFQLEIFECLMELSLKNIAYHIFGE